jgi:hypothetical protein
MLQQFELIIIVAAGGVVAVVLAFGTLLVLSKTSGKKK